MITRGAIGKKTRLQGPRREEALNIPTSLDSSHGVNIPAQQLFLPLPNGRERCLISKGGDVMLTRFGDFDRTLSLMDELRRRMDRVWDDIDNTSWPAVSGSTAWPRINVFDAVPTSC